MPLIKNGKIVDDPWTAVPEGASLPESGALLVSYETWTAHRDALIKRNVPLGVRLASDQSPALIAEDLDRLELVALEFPVFKDGRAYSYARLLRERYGYTEELRAVGNVLRDQFLFMQRCGFDALEVEDPGDADAWTESVAAFSAVYQPATDRRRPIGSLRHRKSVQPSDATIAASWAY